MNRNIEQSRFPKGNSVFVISTRPTRGNSKLNIAVYVVLCLTLLFFLTREYGAQMATRVGIALNMLSFLFVSPELFGIKDISTIQNSLVNLADKSAQRIIDLFALLEINRPSIIASILDMLFKPTDLNYKAHDWINSTESSPLISLLNLLLLWLTPFLLFTLSFLNSANATVSFLQVEYVRYVLFNFILGCIFSYFALLQTLITVSWHLNAIAILLHEDRERKFLAVLGVLFFLVGEFLQFFAA